MDNTSENIQAGDISGMGSVSLPTDGKVGSGDVPAGRKKKKKKKLKNLLGFDDYINKYNETNRTKTKRNHPIGD